MFILKELHNSIKRCIFKKKQIYWNTISELSTLGKVRPPDLYTDFTKKNFYAWVIIWNHNDAVKLTALAALTLSVVFTLNDILNKYVNIMKAINEISTF